MSIPIRTTLSGLYRHRRDLGLHGVGYIKGNLHSRSPSLPSMPSRVQFGHGYSLRPSCLHSPSVRPMANRPDAQGPLSPGLPHRPPHIPAKFVPRIHNYALKILWASAEAQYGRACKHSHNLCFFSNYSFSFIILYHRATQRLIIAWTLSEFGFVHSPKGYFRQGIPSPRTGGADVRQEVQNNFL